uniref:B30.2/SPRY domain-containing protein n=1 Tax=Clastoptera arizonana TaxID=38151 RepID=A0A1B6CXM2_9HEMI
MTSLSSTNPRTQWSPIFNVMWSRGHIETIASRDGVQILYDRFSAMYNFDSDPEAKETVQENARNCALFVNIVPQWSEFDQVERKILEGQILLSRSFRSKTIYSIVLKKRLTVLGHLLRALAAKSKKLPSPSGILDAESQLECSRSQCEIEPPRTGSGALVEVAVHSGLSLLFALLRQNWSHEAAGGPAIYHDVLTSAITIIKSLPPLTLVNDKNQLGQLGVDSLNKVAKFLKEMTQPNSGTDTSGQLLAAELLLHLALQRGSLCYLLEWVDTALEYSKQGGTIGNSEFLSLLRQMNIITAEMKHKLSQYGPSIPLYKAAMIIMSNIVGSKDEMLCGVQSKFPPERSEVYVWGNNSCSQLGNENKDNVCVAELAPCFINVQSVEAGLYCTFLLHTDGEVSACGKGSYGRLGLGSSVNQDKPKKLVFNSKIKKLSSSKGSDGHTIALSVDGQVYSWGDGDHGKLGHGISDTISQPQIINYFKNLVVVCISAGYRHSAAVTSEGELYTWGESRNGRLGHEDAYIDYIKNPTKVQGIDNVGSVSCGFSHTLALSIDGKTVWSFGGGEFGKLGHSNLDSVSKPKEIEAIQGLTFSKVAAGSNFSVALTTSGQVYVCGVRDCIGLSISGEIAKSPKLVKDLLNHKIVDISVGDGHTLALTHDGFVFAWGHNTKGQCGQGRISPHVMMPKRVIGLDGIKICQITAGTSHSIAWTMPPSERLSSIENQPFIVDVEESTFTILHSLLEKYCESFNHEEIPQPFTSSKDHETFVLLCLQLLCNHLGMKSNSKFLPNEQSNLLKELLFKLIDLPTPASIQAKVGECLAVGVLILIPTVKERLKILHYLLNQTISKSQIMLLGIVGSSLKDQFHCAILGVSNDTLPTDSDGIDLFLIKHLLDKILGYSHLNIIENFTKMEVQLEKNEYHPWQQSHAVDNLVYDLYSFLIMHLIAALSNKSHRDAQESDLFDQLILHNVRMFLEKASEVFSKCTNILFTHPDISHKLHAIVYDSPFAGVLTHIIHSFLILPFNFYKSLVLPLLLLISDMDQLIHLLPLPIEYSSEANTPTNDISSTESWLWLLDLVRAASVLVGNYLNKLLVPSSLTSKEKETSMWLKDTLLANGLEDEDFLSCDFDESTFKNLAMDCIGSDFICQSWTKLPSQVKSMLELCINVAKKDESSFESPHGGLVFKQLDTHSKLNSWPSYNYLVDLISNVFLLALIKHCGLDLLNAHEYILTELFKTVHTLKESLPMIFEDDTEPTKDDYRAWRANISKPFYTHSDNQFERKSLELYSEVLSRSIFLLLMKGPSEIFCNHSKNYDKASLCSWNDPESFSPDPVSKWELNDRCISVMHFVLNKPVILDVKQHGSEGESFETEDIVGFSSEPYLLLVSMKCQIKRFEDKLYALNIILKLLRDKASHKEMHLRKGNPLPLLSCFYEPLISVSFGLGMGLNHMQHYLDYIENIQPSKKDQITEVIQEIYSLLVESLLSSSFGSNKEDFVEECQEKYDYNEYLYTVTLFLLSIRYTHQDIKNAKSNGLLSCLKNYQYVNLTEQNVYITNAVIHLLKIIVIRSTKYEDLDVTVLNEILEALYAPFGFILNYLKQAKENINGDKLNHFSLRNVEIHLADLLAFFSFINDSTLRTHLASENWINLFIQLMGFGSDGLPLIKTLTTRLQCLEVLTTLLMTQNIESDKKKELIKTFFSQMSTYLWNVSLLEAESKALRHESDLVRDMEILSSPEATFKADVNENCTVILEAGFDIENCSKSISVQGGNTAVHISPGGRGYALGDTAMQSGCYQWRFLILKEHRGNEGTCVGVSKWPVRDYNHRTTSDMWLYRGYSGHIYHSCEQFQMLPSFTEGDFITVIMDFDSKSLSFGKNDEEPIIAFQDMDVSTVLYPCVVFYSTKPEEKVKLLDMQKLSTPRELSTGEPKCAPSPVVMAEAYLRHIRFLHLSEFWMEEINKYVLHVLNLAKEMISDINENKVENASDNLEDKGDSKPCNQKTLKPTMDVNSMNFDGLCKTVWPVLAFIGGFDRGLCVGGLVLEKKEMSSGKMLGTLRNGLKTVKVLWEATNEISDCLLERLETTEDVKFEARTLPTLSAEQWTTITRLAGIKSEIIFPHCELSPEEMEVMNPDSVMNVGEPPTPLVTTPSNSALSTVEQSYERITHHLVSTIMDEVTKRSSSEHIMPSTSSVCKRELEKKQRQDAITSSLANERLLNCESVAVRLSCIQMSALKTVCKLFTNPYYTGLLLVPKYTGRRKADDNGFELKEMEGEKNRAKIEEENLRIVVLDTIRCLVDLGLSQSELSKVASLEELERVWGILHSSHNKGFSYFKYRINTLISRVHLKNNNFANVAAKPNVLQTSNDRQKKYSH